MAELRVKSATAADGTFSATGSTVWDAGMDPVAGTVLSATFGGTGLSALGTGVATALGINVGSAGAFLTANAAPSYPVTVAGTVTSGGIPYFSSTTVESSSALLAQNGVVLGGGAGTAPNTSANLTFTGGSRLNVSGDVLTPAWRTGTASTDVQLTKVTNGFNEPTATFLQGNGTAGAAIHANFMTLGSGVDSSTNLGIWFNGGSFISVANGVGYAFSANTGSLGNLNTIDTIMVRAGVNAIRFNGTLSDNSISRAEINKQVTAIANNTATATLTVTIPNGNHSAGGRITFNGSAGAGGAIGANEFSALIEYDFVIARTTGVNAVVTLSAALLAAITASVAGGATPTISAAVSAISGAVGASNTFTFNVTINALTGSSTNHTCFVYATLINSNASGVTIA